MRVLVVGNVAFDETLAVETWPVPGASILCRPVTGGPGGKGLNQAAALARAGIRTRLVAGIGADARGAAIRAVLAAEPLELALVVMPDRATDLSVVLSAPDGDNCNVTTTDCAGALAPEDVRAAFGPAAEGEVLLVQGNLGAATTQAALELAGARGMMRVMNPSPLRPWQAGLLAECETVFVNAAEAEAFGGVSALHAAGVGCVVLTRGACGALVSGPGGIAEVAAAPAEVRDTTGAGDAFLGAALAAALLRGAPIDAAALRAGTLAAAIAVSRPGAFASLPTAGEFGAIMRP